MAEGSVIQPNADSRTSNQPPQPHRWPITELMTERAFRQFAELMVNFEIH